MSQKSGKGPLLPFMLKNKGGPATKSAPQPQVQVEKPKDALAEREAVERDAQIIQARIQEVVVDGSASKKQKKDGPTFKNPKPPTTATPVQHLFAKLGQHQADETETVAWVGTSQVKNAEAVTRCLAEGFIRQASHLKDLKNSLIMNSKLETQVKVLKFKLEEDVSSLKKTHEVDMQAKDEELKKSFAEVERLTSELKETKEKMEADVAKLSHELEAAKAEKSAAVEESLAKGPVDFMKEFIRKIPDFDWERLGPGNAKFAESLRVEIAAEDAEEARLTAEANKSNPDEAAA